MTTRILLADDHRLVREGLCSLIKQQFGMEVVAEAKDGRTAVRLARKLRPSLVITDVAMPGLNGIDATRQILSEAPGVKVIALSIYSNSRFVAAMLDAGASGYLLKDCSFEELISAIHTVIAGQTYLSPGIAGVMDEGNQGRLSATTRSVYSVLTHRQRKVLQLMAEGKSTKEIASILRISVKTVETYRQQIMKRLNIRSVAGLTRYAIREELIPLGD